MVVQVDSDRQFYLIEWAHFHVDFQLAEVASVLDMDGFVEHCLVHPLPRQKNKTCRFEDFKLCKTENETHRSFLIISLPCHIAKDTLVTALTRCVLVRGVIELWAADIDIDTCADTITNTIGNMSGDLPGSGSSLDPLVREFCMDQEKSWKMTVATLGSKYSRDEQNEMRLKFSDHLPFAGPVVMTNPSAEFVLIREIELDQKGSPLYPRHGNKGVLIPENDQRPPLGVYFGRVLGQGRNMREKWDKFKLTKRAYLGPTSMDSELSMVMTNLAQVSMCINDKHRLCHHTTKLRLLFTSCSEGETRRHLLRSICGDGFHFADMCT
jgi:hypothetical protein